MADAPFHYSPILQELSEALRCIVNASDWHEVVGPSVDVPEADRRRSERGNLQATLARLKNAYQATRARLTDIETTVLLQEQTTMTASAPDIAKTIAELDETTLPENLRREP